MTDDESRGLLLTYVLLLPDPLPIPHGSTWSYELDIAAPGLSGFTQRPTPEGPPWDTHGSNFVSLKLWQASETRTDAHAAVSRVVDSIIGTERAESHPSSREEETYRTVVEAATWVDDETDEDETEIALTRCIDKLLALHRSYRLATNAPVPELTYERIHPVVMRLERSLDRKHEPRVVGMTILSHMNIPVAAPEPLTTDVQQRMALYAERVSAGDPFALYAERRLDGQNESNVNGRRGESVVQTAIAAEVLFDATLGLVMWEESQSAGLTIEDAATVFSIDLLKRVRSQYHERLGGSWSIEGKHLSRWYTEIAQVRGRVVHAGYRPTLEEAASARGTLLELETFVGDRLAANFKKYPKTAWLFLGHNGFVERGKAKAAGVWADGLSQPIAEAQSAWLREYATWRAAVNASVERRQRSQ